MLKKAVIPFLIVVVAIVVAVVMSRLRPEPEQTEPTVSSVLVDVMPVQARDAAISVPSQGTVEPRTETSLIAQVSGQVTEVSESFESGGFFREGELLLKLDDRDYQAAVTRAEASVAAARSALAQEQGQADVARREFDRMSEDQRNQLRSPDLYLRQPQLQEAQANLASAQADLEQARTDLSRTEIRAPYDGIIREKNTDRGQFVNVGTTLAEIFAVDYAEIRLPIPEGRVQFLELPEIGATASQGLPVDLVSRAGGREYHWEGRLARTEGVLDPSTRSLFSVVRVEDPYNLRGNKHHEPLRIGTFVNASIEGQRLEDVVVLPRHTLQSGDTVWVTDQEKRLRNRDVEVVTVNGDNAYIAEGFEPGDQVVITRLDNPLNGMLVETNVLPSEGIQ